MKKRASTKNSDVDNTNTNTDTNDDSSNKLVQLRNDANIHAMKADLEEGALKKVILILILILILIPIPIKISNTKTSKKVRR